MIKYISNFSHYSDVLAHCKNVKHSLWIGTADIKDAYIEDKVRRCHRYLRHIQHMLCHPRLPHASYGSNLCPVPLVESARICMKLNRRQCLCFASALDNSYMVS